MEEKKGRSTGTNLCARNIINVTGLLPLNNSIKIRETKKNR